MTLLRILAPLALLAAAPAPATFAPAADTARWQAQAARVTIQRDDWGIAHVHGRSDADAVFGAIYAQAEDDFPRIEANFLTALGRTAEAEGEAAIWQDLRQRLVIDPVRLQADYTASPAWLRELMDAWADGLNYYLATHPDTKPRVLTRFEPWMALSFTEGSIGGDIERADLKKLANFYGAPPQLALIERPHNDEPSGSNGIAIAPKLSRDGHAMLLINPHTSFFFRSELSMRSDAGLHAYGASTWGQFFLYQGFNERLGWMHTSTGADSIDEFAETIVRDGGKLNYRYGNELRPVREVPVTIRFRRADGSMGARAFTTYATHHGPIVRADGDTWVAFALMHRPIPALQQSWLRTKATSFADYMKVAGQQANSSNNTVYADADGHIALLHPQFVPERDNRFDYRAPVDGSDPATDWRGLTPLAKLPEVRDPAAGWLYNSNDAPWRAAGADSPKAADFPRYMDQAGDNPRGTHATGLLSTTPKLTPDGLRKIAYDPAMPMFTAITPKLVAAWTALPAGDALRAKLAGPVALLRGWDSRWSVTSQPTTLANYWADALWAITTPAAAPTRSNAYDWMENRLSGDDYLTALDRAVDKMQADWGGWRVPWGQVNRFQRNDGSIVQTFDDAKPSAPVAFASARWGSLASFGAKQYPGTKKWYGTNGNSFVAIVSFGPRVKAWAVSAGGESGHPTSPHFADQTVRYATGTLRPVYFYPEDLKGHVTRNYRPGE
jgi:acyl-homoserine-lactone acylase